MSDEGEILGVDHVKNLLDILPNKIMNALGIVCDINEIKKGEHSVIEIHVAAQPFPVNYHWEYFYQSGATKQTLCGQALNQFLMKKCIFHGKVQSYQNINHFRNESFTIFKEKACLSKRMGSEDLEVSKQELMERLELIEHGKCKRAGILLFHQNPEKWISGAYVKIGYFETDADIHY